MFASAFSGFAERSCEVVEVSQELALLRHERSLRGESLQAADSGGAAQHFARAKAHEELGACL